MRDNVSAPMHSTFLNRPDFTNAADVSSAYKNPLHAAERSKAGVEPMPKDAATKHAVDGNAISGVAVPTTTRSISLASTPAAFIARVAAWLARVAVDSVDEAIRRSLIPVRCMIHSSLVSTIRERSSFVSRFSGTYDPVPAMMAE